ncbi:MAG: septum formation initiator family protein [Bacteroidales bacterium]|nr:septum formation initiator family protein [Bacteroidales bacterium]
MKKLREFWAKYSPRINKYWLVTIVFFVFTFVVGDNSLIMRMKYDEKISQLEKEIRECEEKIKNDKAHLEMLSTDPSNLEKFAREQYLMKRENEEIFLFDE